MSSKLKAALIVVVVLGVLAVASVIVAICI